MKKVLAIGACIALSSSSAFAGAPSSTSAVTPGAGVLYGTITDGSGHLEGMYGLCDGVACANQQTVKAASTAPVATDQAAVVAISPNTPAYPVNTVTSNNVSTQAHVCSKHVFKHITTATDTQIIGQNGTQTIYVCDYSISFNGTGNIYLEKATTGTCATLTQIDQAWYGVANAGKLASNPLYEGLNTGASAQLCANTSANVTIDIAVNYDQY